MSNNNAWDKQKRMALTSFVMSEVKREDITVSVNLPRDSMTPVIRTDMPELMRIMALPSVLFKAACLSMAEPLSHCIPGREREMVDGLMTNLHADMDRMLEAYLEARKKEEPHDKT